MHQCELLLQVLGPGMMGFLPCVSLSSLTTNNPDLFITGDRISLQCVVRSIDLAFQNPPNISLTRVPSANMEEAGCMDPGCSVVFLTALMTKALFALMLVNI
ncbi:unnamed protein product [Pleuronectes platessa]|uniref:Uncharacterized protein n=1 Tax=Pleuronectes platessa TaxID=8262 RepID=A0A9N7TH14_PLEPL|nr:unnamed protein product [Pleuronectes platessa]